jgi:histidinol dehydrogenase
MEYIKSASTKTQTTLDSVKEQTARIVARVKAEGVEGLKALTARFDGYHGPLRVDPGHIDECRRDLDPELKEALDLSAANIRSFHQRQKELFTGGEWRNDAGVTTGIRFVAVQNVAVYVPGGRYPLPSTVLMGVIPAMVAGVERIAIISPPKGEAGIDPVVLGVIGYLGLEEVWAVGGAQAIAALALGVGEIEPVDMIVGPGNAYVTEAKRLLFGQIGIDGLAGPSEVLIIADRTASPEFIAADLLAQAEHDPMSVCTLFCTDKIIAEKAATAVDEQLRNLSTSAIASESWTQNGRIVHGTLDEAIEWSNTSAPEHLELLVEAPREVLAQCRNYGSAFLGQHTTVPFGDFITGTNHVLPTAGAAKFSGGLWTGTFLKALTHQIFEAGAPGDYVRLGAKMAAVEGLAAHEKAIKMRG